MEIDAGQAGAAPGNDQRADHADALARPHHQLADARTEQPPGQVRVGTLIRQLEQDQPIVECFRSDGGLCVLTPTCRLRGMLQGAKDQFYRALDAHTLADCVAGLPG